MPSKAKTEACIRWLAKTSGLHKCLVAPWNLNHCPCSMTLHQNEEVLLSPLQAVSGGVLATVAGLGWPNRCLCSDARRCPACTSKKWLRANFSSCSPPSNSRSPVAGRKGLAGKVRINVAGLRATNPDVRADERARKLPA